MAAKRIFDAHCDTLLRPMTEELFKTGAPEAHVDLPRLAAAFVGDQVMAICCEAYRGSEREYWDRGVNAFRAVRDSRGTNIHFALEGCLPIHEGWELPEKPVVASLTWNGDNPYAGGIGSTMDLTGQGRELARQLHRGGTALDVSHLNDGSRRSLLRLGLPVCATHCNARALCDGKNRNLPDDDIREIAAGGGVIGITFVPDFLEDEPGRASIESILNHLEYIAELTSSDAVGFGSDFDGVGTLPTGVTGAESWLNIIRALEQRGWSEEDIEKAAGANWRRFFEQDN